MKYITNYTRGCFIHWTISHAISEAVANALDSDGELSFDFGEDYISLTNKDIKVSNKMLLSGLSDKRNDESKRGRHGLGIIQMMVVLTDLNIGVEIRNNDICWSPKFEHCDKFNEDIMVIEETPCSNGNDFTVFITGLSEEDIDEVKQRCLEFQDREVLYSTEYGDIISGVGGEGEVFVGDMYVCQNKSFRYNYNFKPKGISLSQDRDAVSQWDLQVQTAKLILATKDRSFIKEAIRMHSLDTDMINKYHWAGYTQDDLNDDMADDFLSKHGAKIVTSSYDEHRTHEKLGNPSVYIQNTTEVNAIQNSELYKSAMSNINEVERVDFSTLCEDTLRKVLDLLDENGIIDLSQEEQSDSEVEYLVNNITDLLDRVEEGSYD